MSASLIQNDFDFEKASKLLNVMIDPRSSDDGSPVVGQQWFNTTSKRVKGYDGTTVFSLMRLDGTDTYTGIITFNPASGSVPFTVDATKNGVVTNLNSDRVDGYHVAEAATVSTIAARDASGNITVATPTSDGHAATKAYVDSIAAGQDWKDSCLVATTANITLSGTQTIDGVAVVADDRVLVKDQTTASENGIYVCAAGAWSRASDADENAEVTSGLTTYIEQGTDNAGAGYTLTTSGAIVVGTTALTFTRTSGGSVYSDGNGMVKSGTTFHFAQAASYTVGALPYANSASTIGFISAVDSGKVLKSNGTGTVPIWAAVDLTADVTGTLPVGKGGTGTATQFTQGSVIFAGASGVYSQDNAGLFFDATNNRLGVGKASPAYNLDVVGTAYFSGSATIAGDLEFTGAGRDILFLDNSGAALEFKEGANIYQRFVTTNGSERIDFYKNTYFAGNVGIGTTTLTDKLNVAGNIRLADGAARSIIGPANEDLKIISSPNSATEGIKWYVDGGTTPGMVLLQTGKLGIGGGIVPAELVHLYTGAAEDIKLRMDSNSTGSAYLELDRQTSAGKAGIILQDGSITKWTFGDLNGNNSFVFDSASVSDALVILQDGKVGIGTDSPLDILHIKKDAGVISYWEANPSTADAYIGNFYGSWNGTNIAAISFRSGSDTANKDSGDIAFFTSNTGGSLLRAMTIDENQRVGIGTPSPSAKLSILQTAGQGDIEFGNDGTGGFIQIYDRSTSAYKRLAVDALDYRFEVSNAAAVVINSSGNVGIGTTDIENWVSTYRALEGYRSAFVYSTDSNFIGVWSNAYSDGTNKYKSTGAAARYYALDGAHVFQVAASGTIDTGITWTNAFVIASNGSLSVSSTTLVDNLNADTVDGYEAADLLDLANSTGDTDDISEGLTNLFYTDARARAAISSTDSAEIAYNSISGVLGLGTEAGRVKSGTIGDGASTSLTFTHNLGTRDVIVQVFQTGTPYKTVFCGITRNTVNQVTLDFSTAPASNSRTVVVTAANG